MLGDEASHFNVDDRDQTLARAAERDTAQRRRASGRAVQPRHVGDEVRKKVLEEYDTATTDSRSQSANRGRE